MNVTSAIHSNSNYGSAKSSKSFCKSLFHIIKKALHFITCSRKNLSGKKIKKIPTVSSALRKEGYKKGLTNQKVDYLLKLLTKEIDYLQWMSLERLKIADVDQKTIILQTLEITTPETLENYQKNVPIYLKQFITSDNLPSKIFIPFAYKYPIAHSMLIVIEPEDENTAQITLVDSLGDSKSYRKTLMGFAEELQTAFPSSNTSVVCNTVSQQCDGISCGVHVIENILLLAKQENAQQFVEDGKLPIRSPKNIKQIFRKYIQKMDELDSIKV